jgi:hypothetical protein
MNKIRRKSLAEVIDELDSVDVSSWTDTLGEI